MVGNFCITIIDDYDGVWLVDTENNAFIQVHTYPMTDRLGYRTCYAPIEDEI